MCRHDPTNGFIVVLILVSDVAVGVSAARGYFIVSMTSEGFLYSLNALIPIADTLRWFCCTWGTMDDLAVIAAFVSTVFTFSIVAKLRPLTFFPGENMLICGWTLGV